MNQRIIANPADPRTHRVVQRLGGMVKRTIIVPTHDNDGRSLLAAIADLQAELLELAGGFSVAGSAGVWRSADDTIYRDRSVTYMVVIDAATDAVLVARLPKWATSLRQEVLYTDKTIVEVGLVVTDDTDT